MRFWYLSVAVDKTMRMRISPSFGSAMASFFKMCRLHTIGRGSVVKCLQKVDTFLHRNIGTNVVAVQGETRVINTSCLTKLAYVKALSPV